MYVERFNKQMSFYFRTPLQDFTLTTIGQKFNVGTLNLGKPKLRTIDADSIRPAVS